MIHSGHRLGDRCSEGLADRLGGRDGRRAQGQSAGKRAHAKGVRQYLSLLAENFQRLPLPLTVRAFWKAKGVFFLCFSAVGLPRHWFLSSFFVGLLLFWQQACGFLLRPFLATSM